MMVLTTNVRHGHLTGTLTRPRHFEENSTGKLSEIRLPLVTEPVKGKWKGKAMLFVAGYKPGRNFMRVTTLDGNHILLDGFRGYVPPWKFERVANGEPVEASTDWPAPQAAP